MCDGGFVDFTTCIAWNHIGLPELSFMTLNAVSICKSHVCFATTHTIRFDERVRSTKLRTVSICWWNLSLSQLTKCDWLIQIIRTGHTNVLLSHLAGIWMHSGWWCYVTSSTIQRTEHYPSTTCNIIPMHRIQCPTNVLHLFWLIEFDRLTIFKIPNSLYKMCQNPWKQMHSSFWNWSWFRSHSKSQSVEYQAVLHYHWGMSNGSNSVSHCLGCDQNVAIQWNNLFCFNLWP